MIRKQVPIFNHISQYCVNDITDKQLQDTKYKLHALTTSSAEVKKLA